MHKIVNLDDERNKLTITISEKEFEISRIVHSLIVEYGEYMQLSGNYLQETARLQSVVDKKTATTEQIKIAGEMLQKQIVEYSEKKVDAILSMTQKIVEKNGYTYNEQWWLDNVTIPEMEKFCVTCIQKDLPEPGKDKKKEPVTN